MRTCEFPERMGNAHRLDCLEDAEVTWVPCACGGVIVSEGRYPAQIEDAVARHGDEVRHLRWQIAGLRGEAYDITRTVYDERNGEQ